MLLVDRTIGAAALLGVLGLATGCSFYMRPPPDSATLPVSCTSSRAAPIGDTVGAGILFTLAIIGLGNWLTGSTCEEGNSFCITDPKKDGRTVLLITAPPAVVFGIAAGVGYTRAARCREMKDASGRIAPEAM